VKLEFVNHLSSFVILFPLKIFRGQLFVEMIVDPRCELHLVYEVEQDLGANAFDLSKRDILMLLSVLDLLVHDLTEYGVE
jgi:hypothetical protein